MLAVVIIEVPSVISIKKSHDGSAVPIQEKYIEQLAATDFCYNVCMSCTIGEIRDIN